MNKVSINLTPPLTTLLTVLFVGLKLTGYINWPWLWVLSPLWIPLALFLGFASFCLFMHLLSRDLR